MLVAPYYFLLCLFAWWCVGGCSHLVGAWRLCGIALTQSRLFPDCEKLNEGDDPSKNQATCNDAINGHQCCFDTDTGRCINGAGESPDDGAVCKVNGRNHKDNAEELEKVGNVYDGCGMNLPDASGTKTREF